MTELDRLLEAERNAQIAYQQACVNHRGQTAALRKWKMAKARAMEAAIKAGKPKAKQKPLAWRCNICGVFIEPTDRKPDDLCKPCRDALTGNGFSGMDTLRASSLTRSDFLDQAKANVCGQREQDYGIPERNFTRIAALWTAYLGHNVTAIDVSMMMVLLKVARAKSSPMKADNFIDMAGYAACGGEIGSDRI